MSHNTIIGLLAFITLATATAVAQTSQPLPDQVTELCLENHAQITIVQATQSHLSATVELGSAIAQRGHKLVVTDQVPGLTLGLAPGCSIAIHTANYAQATLQGAMQQCPSLSVVAEDFSVVRFAGTAADTVRCQSLSLHTEDYATIAADAVLQTVSVSYRAADYSRIELFGVDYATPPNGTLEHQRTTIDHGRISIGRTTQGGQLLAEDSSSAITNADAASIVADMADRLAVFARHYANTSTIGTTTAPAKRCNWHCGGFGLDFAWGWHNWGASRFSGFMGADGAAEVGTTFNNIQLTGQWNIASNRWLGFYVGLGLEWDKWRFTTPEVMFDATTNPMDFAATTATTGTTLLTTRYIEVPLSVRIGSTKGVHLILSAIPGLHWNASGLRHRNQVAGRTTVDKDRSVNKYINPYMLDLRATLYYGWFGIYAQFSTQPVLKTGCAEYFPVRFGFVL